MIEAILRDALCNGAVINWWIARRTLFPDTYVIVDRQGTMRMTRQAVEDYCVGLAIGRGEIPDPSQALYAWAYH